MARVTHVNRAPKDQGPCGKCGTPIKKGDPYQQPDEDDEPDEDSEQEQEEALNRIREEAMEFVGNLSFE